MKKNILIIISFFLSLSVFSQDKYWITFTDKDTINYNYKDYLSEAAVQNREKQGVPLFQATDIPVKEDYIDSLSILGIDVECTSRWFNSVSAIVDEKQLSRLSNASYVSGLEPVNDDIIITSTWLEATPKEYGLAVDQMEGELFAREG